MAALSGWDFSEDYRDYLKFILINILPRVILALLLSLLFASIDNYASLFEIMVFVVFFCFLIYHFIPPTVDTVYVIKKTGDPEADEALRLKLLRASKDSYSGIYALEGSLVIKSYLGRAVKFLSRLKERHDLTGHEVSRQVKSIKGFNDEYHKLLDRVAWRVMAAPAPVQVARYNLKNLEDVEL
jgi:hypothetical protein